MVPAFKIPKIIPLEYFLYFRGILFHAIWLSDGLAFSQSGFQAAWISVSPDFSQSGFQSVRLSDGPGELQCCRNGMLSYAADCGVRLCPTVSDNAQILFPLYEEVGGTQFNLATIHVGKDLKALSGGGYCHVALAVDDIFKYDLC